MTDLEINRMIDRGRIILRPLDALTHYGLILSIGVLNSLMIMLAWNQAGPDSPRSTMTNEDIVIVTAVGIFLMGAFYLIQRERLKLEKLTIDLEDDEIFKTINEVGAKFNWLPSTMTREFIQAHAARIFGTSNRITIFIRGKNIYINCRTTSGEIGGFIRQGKITEGFLSALRMRSYEIQHKKEQLKKQASR